MYIIAEPVTEEQVQEIQSKNKEKIVEFERNILGLHKEDEVVPPAKLPEEDTSKWEEIQAKVEEELENDELSSGTATNTQQPDSMIAVGPSDDAGAEGPPDAPATFDSGPLLAPRSIEAESEKPAASATDQVEEEEEDDDDEDDDGDDGEDEDGEEDEESDDDEERDDAEDDEEEEEENVSGTAGEEENIMERDSDTTGAMNEEIAASEPPPDEDINKTSDSKVEQETVDNPQEETATKSKTQGDTAQNDKEQAGAKTPKEFSDLLAMTLTIRNKVNGKYVPRPEKLGASNKWSVEYSLAEIQSQSRAWNLYGACQMRRKKKLDDDGADEEDVAKNYYLRRIRELSERGRQWRNKQDEIEGKVDKVVLDRSSPSNPEHTDGPSMHDG